MQIPHPGQTAGIRDDSEVSNGPCTWEVTKPRLSSTWGLGEACAVAAAGFEDGEEIAEAKEFADARAQIDQLQGTALVFCGDVDSDDRTEAGAVHSRKLCKVEDHALCLRYQFLDVSLQEGGVSRSEDPAALHDDIIFELMGAQFQIRCGHFDRVGHGLLGGSWRECVPRF